MCVCCNNITSVFPLPLPLHADADEFLLLPGRDTYHVYYVHSYGVPHLLLLIPGSRDLHCCCCCYCFTSPMHAFSTQLRIMCLHYHASLSLLSPGHRCVCVCVCNGSLCSVLHVTTTTIEARAYYTHTDEVKRYKAALPNTPTLTCSLSLPLEQAF